MKKLQFDLEKAKAGAKLVTREGKPARIICWDFKHEKSPIIALIDKGDEELAIACAENGGGISGFDSDNDLFILEESTYRPYANAEEILKGMKEHGPMVREKNNERYYPILGIDEIGILIGEKYCHTVEEIKHQYNWQDGHPFGVSEACCGNCIHFENEDIDGNGWCAEHESSESVGNTCPTWEWKGGEE